MTNQYQKPVNNTGEIVIPNSCCITYLQVNNVCTRWYGTGCFNRLNSIISQSAMLIATGAITVAFVQVSNEFVSLICMSIVKLEFHSY